MRYLNRGASELLGQSVHVRAFGFQRFHVCTTHLSPRKTTPSSSRESSCEKVTFVESVFKRNKIFYIPWVLYKYAHTAAFKSWETLGEAEHTRLSRELGKPRYGTMLRKLTATVLPYCAVTVLLFVAFVFLSFLRLLPCTKWIVVKLMQMITTITLPTEVYWHSLFTWHMLNAVRTMILLELQKSARINHTAPNPSLVSLNGLSHCRLLSFCKGNRPLVVNFGSWTCPVFRSRVGEFLSLAQEYSDVADFLTVYIEEAHPSNGWAFKVSRKIPAYFNFKRREM